MALGLTTVSFPEFGWRGNGVPIRKYKQVFVASDQIVGLRRSQGSQYWLIGLIPQSCILFGSRFDDVSQGEETVGEVPNLSRS